MRSEARKYNFVLRLIYDRTAWRYRYFESEERERELKFHACCVNFAEFAFVGVFDQFRMYEVN